ECGTAESDPSNRGLHSHRSTVGPRVRTESESEHSDLVQTPGCSRRAQEPHHARSRVAAAMTTPDTFVRELSAVGVSAQSPWDLVNTRQPYRLAIPVLVAWLDRVDVDVPEDEREKFREGLVRS